MKECKIAHDNNIDEDAILSVSGFNPDLPYERFQSKDGPYDVFQQKEGDEWIVALMYRISELEDQVSALMRER